MFPISSHVKKIKKCLIEINHVEFASSFRRRLKCAARWFAIEFILIHSEEVCNTSLFSLIQAHQIDLKHKLAQLYHGGLTLFGRYTFAKLSGCNKI